MIKFRKSLVFRLLLYDNNLKKIERMYYIKCEISKLNLQISITNQIDNFDNNLVSCGMMLKMYFGLKECVC